MFHRPCVSQNVREFQVQDVLYLQFRKAWMPFFCRSGHPVVTPDQFLGFIGNLLPQEFLDLPRITGRDFQEVARAKKSIAGGLDTWAERA